MKCTACGEQLAPEDEVCRACGAPAAEGRAAAVEAQPEPVPIFGADKPATRLSKKESRRKWAAIGCIGLLAAACVVAVLLGIWLLSLLSQSQRLPVALPGLPGPEPTFAPRPTPTWLPAPPTPTREASPPTPVPPPTMAPIVVMPYCSSLDQSPVYIGEDQPVTVYWGWMATTSEYVQDFLDTATIEVTLDGEPVEPDTQSDIQYDLVDEAYVVRWYADVGALTQGTHRLEYDVTWSRQISDGWYTFGPGGEYEEEHEYCELIVE
jgi:hypothetical protein